MAASAQLSTSAPLKSCELVLGPNSLSHEKTAAVSSLNLSGFHDANAFPSALFQVERPTSCPFLLVISTYPLEDHDYTRAHPLLFQTESPDVFHGLPSFGI